MIDPLLFVSVPSCLGGANPPLACPEGTFKSTPGFSNNSACLDCPRGHSCPSEGLTTPQGCTNGTYQDATRQTSCHICPAGSMCPVNDAAPISCSGGEYSFYGMVECVACPAGYRYDYLLVVEIISTVRFLLHYVETSPQ